MILHSPTLHQQTYCTILKRHLALQFRPIHSLTVQHLITLLRIVLYDFHLQLRQVIHYSMVEMQFCVKHCKVINFLQKLFKSL